MLEVFWHSSDINGIGYLGEIFGTDKFCCVNGFLSSLPS